MGSEGDSWLCDAAGRERLVQMSPLVRKQRAGVFVLQAVALAVCAPWLGWWTLLPLLAVATIFPIVDRRMPRSPRPEYLYFAAWSSTQVAIALGAYLSGGAASPVLVWMAVPVATLASRFTTRGLLLGVGVTLTLLIAVTLGADHQLVLDAPYTLLFPLVAVISVALLGAPLMRSDVQHRSEAVVDPLTQLLNRKALHARALELQEQARITGEPVGVVLGDLDHFKAVNDEHGHQVGDQVLQDVAYRMRKALRAYDLAYRLGGEEFLVVLPGAALDETAELAERLRGAVASSPVAGVPITMSFGVAATAPKETFDVEALYARADAALYEAKAAGRNCVKGADRRLTLLG
ncbi:MAG: GGDEF domain-containing protein [Solirubrobacterales bacterium]|nr:GGDEF domain-containing protein [Solirubrobacterales bacterium]